MKSVALILALSAVLFAATVRADSCPDQASQEKLGLQTAILQAKDALPGLEDPDYTISNEKEVRLSRADRFWDPDRADYLSFDVIIGKKSGVRFPYFPAAAYTIQVDVNCKVESQLDYTIER